MTKIIKSKALISALFVALLCILLSVVIVLPTSAEELTPTASGSCGENATWEYYESTGELKILGDGDMEKYSSYSEVPWYTYYLKIGTVSIADGITSICDEAFYCHYYLTSVVIGENSQLTSIGERAFYYCDNLTSIEIPISVTSIGYGAFEDCKLLKKVVFEEDSQLASIGAFAFCDCYSLISIEIPTKVGNIGSNAFSGCSKLVEIYNLSDFDISINSDSLGGIESNVKSIHASKSEESIIENINGYLVAYFDDTYYILDYTGEETDLILPTSFNYKGTVIDRYEIYDYAFAYSYSRYSKLKSIQIPVSVTGIGTHAFYSTRITDIFIPASVKNIEAGAFAGCNLEEISVEAGNTVYHSAGNCIIETGSKTLVAGFEKSVIPEDGSVVAIGDSAFFYQAGLKSIEIPSSVTSIGTLAFRNCFYLKNVVFKANSQLKSIDRCAFSGCYDLTSIEIPSGVTNIADLVFDSCRVLTSVTFLSDIPSTLGNGLFRGTPIEAIYVPMSAVDTYKAHEDWAEYKDIIFPLEAEKATISFGEYKVKTGKTVSVTVSLENNLGIAIASITLDYDNTALTLKEVENGEIFDTLDWGRNLLWSADANCEGSGVLATLTFEVNENAEAKDYTISAKVNEAYNEDSEKVDILISDGKITTYKFIYGDANDDDVISALDVILLRKYVANYDYTTGISTVSVGLGADANGDGNVTALDVLLMRKYMANYDYDAGTSSIVLGPKE